MPLPLLLLRPQPGNDASAARARAMGLDVIQIPLFAVEPVDSGLPPDERFDALLLTSANAVRFAPALLARFAGLPIYAVGEATALAARESGPGAVSVGGGDAHSTAALIAGEGHERVLHLSGADVRPFDAQGLRVTRHVVYRARVRSAEEVAPDLAAVERAVAAIHSPRAGERFSALVNPARRPDFRVAAISAAAAQACGEGWAALDIAAAPDDTSLLACAETLCIRAG